MESTLLADIQVRIKSSAELSMIVEVFCRGKGRVDGEQTEDDEIRKDLETFQPAPIDTRATISPEEVTNIPALPRGVCTGTLIPDDNSATTTTTTDEQTTTDATTNEPSGEININVPKTWINKRTQIIQRFYLPHWSILEQNDH